MTTPAEKLRLVKMYGTISSVDGKWVFKAHPTKSGNVIELSDGSRWKLIEAIYYLILDYK